MFRRLKEAALQTAVTCGIKDIDSSNITAIFLAVEEHGTILLSIKAVSKGGRSRYL